MADAKGAVGVGVGVFSSSSSVAVGGAAGANAAGAVGDDEKYENVWQDLLKKCSKHAVEANSTVLVFGDKGNGKSHILRKFKERSQPVKSTEKCPEYILDYAYVQVKNVHDDDEPDDVRARMNLWQIHSPEHAAGLLPLLLKSAGFDHTAYVITVDLSQPWLIGKTLAKWLEVISKGHEQIFGALPQADQDRLRYRVSKYNQFYVDPSVSENKTENKADETADVKVDTAYPKVNFGVPLIVVGTKGDAVKKVFETQHGVGDRFEYITRNLRRFCLDYGASLVFTSAVGNGTNADVLQEYLYHRLYNYPNKHRAKLGGSDSEFAVYVPSGFDNEELISSVQPAKASWAETAGWEDVFKNPDAAKAKAVQNKADEVVQAEDNDTFFKKIKFNMENPTQPRAVAPRTTVTTNTNRPAPAPVTVAPAPSTGTAAAAPPSPVPSATRPSASSVDESGTAGAGAAAAAAAADANKKPGAAKPDKAAVKDFFISLLADNKKKTGAVTRDKTRKGAQDALSAMRGAKPEDE